ncbi:hypothetical protein HETIRDRAFT_155012 [Heterobasidion irregulare TC 32-1]|uniref:DUF747-domain-containing protein n=1 Tax=Heterobasidion irregulare (strain TC 32-1) TaxID=747525 RepID=W4K7G8_HETIT|nr:uncharacterized protein HETIRDRAFT_155012 [Heterobasidion irregulare TC 32-1]ETW81011.1 hypothetical protein HETIRDRAFT_155012 [Heterobasidion irregulare TC 32-1]
MPLAYASLPPTPISSSPPPPHSSLQEVLHSAPSLPPFSLWDYLREELLATDFDSHQELKWERVSNFLAIPVAMEKIMGFGFVLCLDSFLYTFTIHPIRFVFALWRVLTNLASRSKAPLPPSQKADILRTLLLALSIMILVPLTDASKIYHSIRGQDTIKLYVIFNALEIADRLCASIGQDIIDCLFSRSTLLLLSRRVPLSTHTLRPILFFGLATLYIVVHALVMVYQLLCLNVAINSYDNALLSLLMSNQFVEIKGSVFKKFEKDNLFQITCADIVERFTLCLMLFFVAFRNLIELSGSEFDFSEGVFLPKSFGWFRGGSNVLWTISYPVMTVMLSETLVDWLKHAFITKFNHIRPSVYERYTDVLCRDLASGSAFGRLGARKHTYVDQSPLVARRLGFSALPLAVLTILIGSQAVSLVLSSSFAHGTSMPRLSNLTNLIWRLSDVEWWKWARESAWEELLQRGRVVDWEAVVRWAKWGTLGLTIWICFVVIKIIMGVNLVSYATKRKAGMEAREVADKVNDFGRDPIGEGREEQIYNRELKTLLDNARHDTRPTAEIGERLGNANDDVEGKKRRPKLEDLTRFTMVKRIW